ncbi:MAG: iron-sulfur cluster assembly scaffold protein [Alphaproteobacteria bacterium]|nr:MAG: iron-sulfur cluster assembly scaffold protein [Alphaproteobacteria bacterium]
MDFYSDIIFDHYKNPRNFGELERPTHTATTVNPFCGDSTKVDLSIKRGKIVDIKFRSEGCAVSIASMSILSEKIIGFGVGKVESMKGEDIEELLGIKLTPTRIKCAILGLQATQKALKSK